MFPVVEKSFHHEKTIATKITYVSTSALLQNLSLLIEIQVVPLPQPLMFLLVGKFVSTSGESIFYKHQHDLSSNGKINVHY